MAIDLQRCIGCGTCMIACKVEHFLPPDVHWSRVLIKEQGKFPAVNLLMVPVLCNHCSDAPCVKVCPAGATERRDDGIVTMDYDKCIGCHSCILACPYGARNFSGKNHSYFKDDHLTPYEQMGDDQSVAGVVMKCTFCQEKIDLGLAEGLKPGVDRDATPSCVTSCTGKARFFGNLDDPESEVSQLIRSRRGKTLRTELGTNPSVYYLE
ncbi:4Fe-4S dicluster domain-containing protein [Chloroflexota bacterium]